MSVVDLLARAVENGVGSLNDLGGASAILADADEIARSPFLDVLVEATASAPVEDRISLVPVLLRGFAACPTPVSFRDAIDRVLECPPLQQLLDGGFISVLVERVERRTVQGNSLLAAYALEALFRIGLNQISVRYRVLAIMTEFSTAETGLFAEHAVALVGAAYHQWGEQPLLATLNTLQAVDDVAAGAIFELAMTRLADALDSKSSVETIERMDAAGELFRAALLIDTEKSEAAAYLAIIDLLNGFATDRPPSDLAGPFDRLERAVNDRQDLASIGRVPTWLQPRFDREVEWLRLVDVARRAAANLARPSWLNAAELLEQVLMLYEADRSITFGKNVHYLFAPRIEASFVRQAGLAAHLDELLESGSWNPPLRPAAERLRSVVQSHQKGVRPSIARGDAKHPLLSGVLPNYEAAQEIPSEMADILEAALAARVFQRELPTNSTMNRIFKQVQEGLGGCPDYQGEVRRRFDDLLLQVLYFCSDRQDMDRRSAGPRIAYLRSNKAVEQDLQYDLREWLVGNLPSADIKSEVSGVAAGRTDLYVGFGSFRFIIELKKHHGLVNTSVTSQYKGQAASYQATGARLGFLGILELVDRTGPPATLEECVWLDAYVPPDSTLPRYLICFRVPGMLKPPSTLS